MRVICQTIHLLCLNKIPAFSITIVKLISYFQSNIHRLGTTICSDFKLQCNVSGIRPPPCCDGIAVPGTLPMYVNTKHSRAHYAMTNCTRSFSHGNELVVGFLCLICQSWSSFLPFISLLQLRAIGGVKRDANVSGCRPLVCF